VVSSVKLHDSQHVSLPLIACYAQIIYLLRHVATRHDTLSITHAFWHRKIRDVLCRACRTARRDTRNDECDRRVSHDTCSGVSPLRGLGWTYPPLFFQNVFLRLMQTCIREHCCYFVVRHVGTSTAQHARQARHARHDALATHDGVRVVSWRDATNGIWALTRFCRQTSQQRTILGWGDGLFTPLFNHRSIRADVVCREINVSVADVNLDAPPLQNCENRNVFSKRLNAQHSRNVLHFVTMKRCSKIGWDFD